ncbi:M14 family zinc carboxypeptidase [Paraferrimonas sedimenticola]|uniref:Peptidase M14 n=1 Tax=Paraferrimonas sedimenticola TaxID=375674 RepID=A0AA37RVX1_9GAMM|nr:M14 family zinc carboxypeptidase [Paraferrimonas sedimenticola]GLP95943.1 peptidase M14 [Paraferrimonas sedimenticola]
MKFRALLLLMACLVWPSAFANPVLPDVSYQSDITHPTDYLGYPVGEWHLRHDQLNGYIQLIAAQSERVALLDSGYSHERRAQRSLLIGDPSLIANKEQLMAERAKVRTGAKQDGPTVIWLAYSIHGDEASGAHVGMLMSYYLAASEEAWVKDLLKNNLVLITPSQNPDGMDRFANWANAHKGQNIVSDNHHREHKQPWPAGRVNHYMQDLNRDWLFLRHPESQGRVKLFQQWLPHVVGDFHEMGHNSTYFFQPGVPSRTNPLTPAMNQELTAQIAKFHQKALDGVRQAYFSRERFDDFFYGKGSTYPDINGSVGILFEQASARGHAQDSDNGVLTLQRAIRNQWLTSISTLEGSAALADELKSYQSEFFKEALANSRSRKGYLIEAAGDSYRRDQLASLLTQHKVEFRYLKQNITHKGETYTPAGGLYLPYQQAQAPLLHSLFDSRTEFAENVFYDISSWHMARAFDMSLGEDASPKSAQLSDTAPRGDYSLNDDALYWLVDYRHGRAPALAQALTSQGVVVKSATKGATLTYRGKPLSLSAGFLMIPSDQPKYTPAELQTLMQPMLEQYQIEAIAVDSGAAASGSDLGSPEYRAIRPVKLAMLGGAGVNQLAFGQLWYYLDRTMDTPTSIVDKHRLTAPVLKRYTHLVLSDGSYRDLSSNQVTAIKNWLRNGGVLVALQNAVPWASEQGLLSVKVKQKRDFAELFDGSQLSYSDRDAFNAKKAVGGAILQLDSDPSHPLLFGTQGERLAVLKNRAITLGMPSRAFASAASYAKSPLLSGYLAKEYQQAFAEQNALMVEAYGQGRVVAAADNLVFRNIWLGTEKIIANSVLLTPNMAL